MLENYYASSLALKKQENAHQFADLPSPFTNETWNDLVISEPEKNLLLKVIRHLFVRWPFLLFLQLQPSLVILGKPESRVNNCQDCGHQQDRNAIQGNEKMFF